MKLALLALVLAAPAPQTAPPADWPPPILASTRLDLADGMSLVADCQAGQVQVALQGANWPGDWLLVSNHDDPDRPIVLSMSRWVDQAGPWLAVQPTSLVQAVIDRGSLSLSPSASPEPVVIDGAAQADQLKTVLEACGQPVALPPLPPKPLVVPDEPRAPLGWARYPAGEFPERAMSRGIERGMATIRCETGPLGALVNCQVDSEFPRATGFGPAAIAATRRARMRPDTPEGTKISFSTRFLMPVEDPPAEAPSPAPGPR